MSHKLNLLEWFDAREVEYVPEHFHIVKTPITPESRHWISESLHGRYGFLSVPDPTLVRFTKVSYPAFELGSEATLYELTWS